MARASGWWQDVPAAKVDAVAARTLQEEGHPPVLDGRIGCAEPRGVPTAVDRRLLGVHGRLAWRSGSALATALASASGVPIPPVRLYACPGISGSHANDRFQVGHAEGRDRSMTRSDEGSQATDARDDRNDEGSEERATEPP